MSRTDLSWLTVRPIAHRGLHDAAHGIIENTRSAVRRAVERGYAIEVDVQLTSDGEVVVFHDDTLERLTGKSGALTGFTLAELRGTALRGTSDPIWTLTELLDEVSGSVPLVVELKSNFSGDTALAGAAGRMLQAYAGPVAAKSFDPKLVASLRNNFPDLVRGCIGSSFDAIEWPMLSAPARLALRQLLHWPGTRPHFLSWDIQDLPRLSVAAARMLAGTPVVTWTVRTLADQARARLHADQIVFEEFSPDL